MHLNTYSIHGTDGCMPRHGDGRQEQERRRDLLVRLVIVDSGATGASDTHTLSCRNVKTPADTSRAIWDATFRRLSAYQKWPPSQDHWNQSWKGSVAIKEFVRHCHSHKSSRPYQVPFRIQTRDCIFLEKFGVKNRSTLKHSTRMPTIVNSVVNWELKATTVYCRFNVMTGKSLSKPVNKNRKINKTDALEYDKGRFCCSWILALPTIFSIFRLHHNVNIL